MLSDAALPFTVECDGLLEAMLCFIGGAYVLYVRLSSSVP